MVNFQIIKSVDVVLASVEGKNFGGLSNDGEDLSRAIDWT